MELVERAVQVSYLVSLLPFGLFLVRANKNATAFGRQLSFSPASMVWWFCVPFLNLVRPYEAVKSVWDASVSTRFYSFERDNVLTLWWGFWVMDNIVNYGLSKINGDADAFLPIAVLASVLDIGLIYGR